MQLKRLMLWMLVAVAISLTLASMTANAQAGQAQAAPPPAGATGPARDQDRDHDQDRDQARDQNRIYGHELMSAQERQDYRERLRAARTAEERRRLMEEHREAMLKRAQERGLTLAEDGSIWRHGMPNGQRAGPAPRR